MSEIRIKRPGCDLLVEYHARAVIEPDIESFIAGLNMMIDGGSHFRAGQTFQIGWAVLRFIDVGNGALAFEELDGSGVPAQFARGVSRALIATRLQKSVNESFGLVTEDQLDFPSQRQAAIACTEIDPDGAMVLARTVPHDPTDSGWFFGCQNEDHDHDDPAAQSYDSLYVHASRVPAVLPFLALPIGTTVVLAADGAVVEAVDSEGNALVVEPGSYLAERTGR